MDKYFKDCDETKQLYTITGLALALGTSRKTLCEYAKKEEFSNTIKAAKQRVEAQVERILLEKGHAGAIFWAKNHGWQDKQQIDVNDVSSKSREELEHDLKLLSEGKK